MTLSELIIDLQTIIGPGLDISNVNLTPWINEAYSHMCDEIIKANPDYFTKSATANTQANIQEYDIPTDFEKALMVNIAYDGTNWQRAKPLENIGGIPAIMQTANLQGTTTAEPFYYILGGSIGFLPIPTSNGVGNIKLWYTYTPSELSASSDTPVLPKKYHHMIKYSAFANFLNQDDQHNASELMRQRFDKRVEEMVENLSRNQVDAPGQIQIVDDDLFIF